MSKSFWAVIIGVIIVFFGIFTLTGKSTPGATNNSTKPSEHIEGLGQDHITLVEYGDYQCPYCGQYYPIVKQIQTEYNNQLYFQFRNFPLTSLHPNAFAAARAAEAASLQGKFWQMHDLLYEENLYNQETPSASTWINATDPTPYFDGYAQQLGLNLNKFKTDYASSQVDNVITADEDAGNKLNVQGTPTFFLNGTQLNVGESASQFQQVINAAIAKATGKSTSSTSTTTGTGSTEQTKK